MDYIELSCKTNQADYDFEILSALLTTIGYDSFVEENNILKAYIPVDEFNMDYVKNLPYEDLNNAVIELSTDTVEDKNWNAVWESNYEPVCVAGRCFIRAPFHNHRDDVEYEIEILPQMSFGTAHHETTHLILEKLLDFDVKGKSVLDMGCGTGVLAILAFKKGAVPVDAIDNDEWAYKNSLENVVRNACQDVRVELGDASLLKDRSYDVIIANINRNILLRDMAEYIGVLNKDGVLVMSGFYTEDIPVIRDKAESLGLTFESFAERNNWATVVFHS
ncbi:MAG: 50S ribosomal protein L11 methyltransferase [Bacteroidales bacterium]